MAKVEMMICPSVNSTLSSLEAGPLVLPHVALALLVVNLPDSRMKR
jgi:hypothetical protein